MFNRPLKIDMDLFPPVMLLIACIIQRVIGEWPPPKATGVSSKCRVTNAAQLFLGKLEKL
jgi:hypothetical protein